MVRTMYINWAKFISNRIDHFQFVIQIVQSIMSRPSYASYRIEIVNKISTFHFILYMYSLYFYFILIKQNVNFFIYFYVIYIFKEIINNNKKQYCFLKI